MSTLFSKETNNFLIENCLQDSKTWFGEHRAQYDDFVVAPLVSLVEKLTPGLLKIDDKLICSPKAGGSVSRIWRDARFSKGKSLFRDTMWCSFVRQKNVGLPEFFFVVSPGSFMYGSGYYSARTASMDSIRKLIINNDVSFQAALSVYKKQNTFRLEGGMYKKSRYPNESETLRNWLDRKTICFTRTSNDLDLLYSDQLPAAVTEGYKTLAPVYNFLIKAEELIK